MERTEAEQKIIDDITRQMTEGLAEKLRPAEPSTYDEIKKAVDIFRDQMGKSLVKLLTDPDHISREAEGRMTAARWITYLIQLSAVRRVARSSKGFALLFALATFRSNLGFKMWRAGVKRVRDNGWVIANVDLDTDGDE